MIYKEFFSMVMVLVVVIVGLYIAIFFMKKEMYKITLFFSLLLAVIIIYSVKAPLRNQEILSGICWVVFFINGLIISGTVCVLFYKEDENQYIVDWFWEHLWVLF